MSSDSIAITGYSYANTKTYNASEPTLTSPHTVTLSMAAGSLASNGLRARLTTTYGEISDVVFSCTGSSSVSSDATLSNLSLSAGAISPSFSSGITRYTASVANAVSSTTVTPVTTDTGATVTVNGSAVSTGSASPAINLAAGTTTNIPIVVIAEDGTTTRSYTIGVTRAEAVPVAGNTTVTVAANSSNNAISLPVTGGTATSVVVVTAPTHGTTTVSGTALTYTPTPGYSGSDSFTYHATNSAGASNDATVSLSVTAPVLTLNPAAGALPGAIQNTAWSQTLSASGGTAPYTWSAVGLPVGITLNATTGVLSGTPTATGNFSFPVTVTDSYNVTSNVSYSLTVAEAVPVAGAVTVAVSANSSNNVIPLALSGGTTASVSIVSPPAHGTARASGTNITYTPTPGYSGADSFIYNATNSAGSSANATVSLAVSATALTFSPSAGALAAATAGSAWTQTIVASGGSSPYTYSASSLPAGITLNSASGVLSGTPAVAGNYTFQITATDSNQANGVVSYTLAVAAGGSAPVTTAVTANIDAGSTDNTITLAIAGSVTSVAVIRQAVHGTARVAGTSIRYTPVIGYSGSDSFTYSASNAFGTSQEATVSLTVTTPALEMTPASGALPEGTVGQAYHQTFNIVGGTSPFRWQLNGALPQGMTFANGELQGTPTTAGTASFSLTATDAQGVTSQTSYSLVIKAATLLAADHSASLYAGQSVKVNLVEGARGGPFTGALLLDHPDESLGSATITSSDSNYELLFTAAPQASGTVALRYTLTSASGVTQPALVTLTIAARPNPATDADVIGLISAQMQAAQNFARAQIRNFNDRLELLHRGGNLPSDHTGVNFTLPSGRAERDADKNMWASAWQQQRKYEQDYAAQQLPAAPFSGSHSAERLSYWTGGYIDFGSDKNDSVRFSHTLVGITTGADYRFTSTFTAGMGLGFGRDVSDVGDSGTRGNGRSLSTALYGSWHPDAFFIDGLAGYSHLEFDSKRYVSQSDAFARGNRSGRQVFGSLTSGYEFRTVETLVSPYARVQYYRTWLDSYAESNAGSFDLAFAAQTFAQIVTTAGLRGEHSVPTSWGLVKLQSRVEYSQLMNQNGSARVGYADVGNDSWSMSLYEQSKQTLALGVGIDFLLPYNITPGIAYQGTLGLDEQQSRSQMITVRVNIGF